MIKVAIIDYGSGNLHSARKAFERSAQESGLACEIALETDPARVLEADHVVLPGVGAFADCKSGIAAIPGMIEALNETVLVKGRPFLGICVGMQLLATRGLEHEVTPGLGWIEGEVVPIKPADRGLKIPHMGWNTLNSLQTHKLLEDIPLGEYGLHAYFVHSFHFQPANKRHILADASYGGPVVAMVGRDNIAGTQFHPEKSQKLGLALISNFLRWRP